MINKFLYKQICILFIICLFCPLLTCVHASEDDYNTNTEMLYKLNVLEPQDVALFSSEKYVSRGEFVKYIIKLLNISVLPCDEKEMPFWDVPSEYINRDYIYTAYKYNFINGYEDKSFRQLDYISFNDALKIFSSVLGYGEYCKYKYNYDSGYVFWAEDINLLTEINLAGEKELRFDDFQVLLSNSLTVSILEQTQWGANKTFSNDSETTILSKYYDIYIAEGILEATEISSLVANNEAGEGSILIDNLMLKNDDLFSAQKLLGRTVECFYKKDKTTDMPRVFYLSEIKSKNEIIEIDISDVLSVENDKITYYSGNKRKTIRLSNDVDWLYNEKNFDFSDRINIIKGIEYGKLVLIDNGNSGACNVVMIYSYELLTVQNVDAENETIYVKDNKKPLVLDSDKAKYVNCVDCFGKPFDFLKLAEWDVITVVKSEDEKYVSLVASFKKAEGYIESRSEQDEKIIVINDEEYKYIDISKDFLSSREPIIAHIDVNGYISSIEISNKSSTEYGYLFKYEVEKGLSGKLKFLVYDEFSEEQILECAEKVFTDGKKINCEKLKDYLDVIKAPLVIEYRLDDSGKINFIDTSYDADDHDVDSKTLRKRYDNSSGSLYYKSSGSFGGKYSMNENTVVYVNTKAADGDITIESIDWHTLKNDTNYNVDIYSDHFDSPLCCAVVLYRDQDDLLLEEISDDKLLYIVEDVRVVSTEDGDTTYRLNLNGKGSSIELLVNPEYRSVADGLDTGDIIRYDTDYKGQIKLLDRIYSYSEDKWLLENNPTSTYDANMRVRLAKGYVYAVQDGFIQIKFDSDANNLNDIEAYNFADCYKYDVNNGEVFVKKVSQNDIAGLKHGQNNLIAVFQTHYASQLKSIYLFEK